MRKEMGYSNGTIDDAFFTSFGDISYEFSKFHTDPANILLHLFTTPLGVLGVLSLIRTASGSSSMGVSLLLLYLFSLLREVSNGVFIGSCILSAVLLYVSRVLRLGMKESVALIVFGYALQDLAHLATGEKTFQSVYSNGGHVS